MIRPGRDADAPAVVALIERCWSDYPGCILDIDREAPELRALATYYAWQGGMLWIAEAGNGMIATAPRPGALWEVCRVYVHPDRHGTGLAAALLQTAERHAQAAGATGFMLWSDTRFARAHRFYEKHGYRQTGRTRALHDLADTTEHHFQKPT